MRKLIYVLLIIILVSISITTCKIDSDSDKTVMFSIDKVDSRTLTVTVEGANWKRDDDISFFYASSILTMTYKHTSGETQTGTVTVQQAFDFKRTSNTVFTYTLKSWIISLSGTVELSHGLEFSTDSFTSMSENNKKTYLINPEKSSITF